MFDYVDMVNLVHQSRNSATLTWTDPYPLFTDKHMTTGGEVFVQI